MHRHIRAGAHGHTDICRGQSGCIINAIAHHHDNMAPTLVAARTALPTKGAHFHLGRPCVETFPTLLELRDLGRFVTRQNLRHHFIGA